MNQPHESARQEKLRTLDWLVETFPAAFFKGVKNVRPLKIGIFDDIIEFYQRLDSPPFSKNALKQALNYYSASPAYLQCQIAGAARLDLFGIEVDSVTKEQAKYAYERYHSTYLSKKLGLVKQKNEPTQK